MTHKTCLRCDWEGETQGPQCPNCGIQPLYLIGASPAKGQVEPVAGDPEGRSREAPSTAPSGTPFPRSDPPPSPTEAVGSSGRSAARSVVAFVLVALVLGITLGTWLDASEERSAPAASSDAAAHETPASDALTDGPLIGRQALTVDGVSFSFKVPTSDWEGFRNLHISKSTAGSQGAEALIYWSRFPGGVDADWCVLDHAEPGPSVAGVADAVSTATGTQLLTGPSNVTIGGRSAKYMVLIVREDVGCDPGFFYNWEAKLGGALWTETKPGDTISVWIVDVDGTLLFIAGETKPEAGPRLEQEIQQIVGSIRFY